MKHAAATLGSGNLRLAVMLPEGEDLNEWVAVNSELFLFRFQSNIFTTEEIISVDFMLF
jgi:MOB kinase activator 1